MAESWLNEFVGQHVTVVTGLVEERSDTGTLLRIGEGWLQMVKDNGDMILVPSTAVRIVKLLAMTQTAEAVEKPVVPRTAATAVEPLPAIY